MHLVQATGNELVIQAIQNHLKISVQKEIQPKDSHLG